MLNVSKPTPQINNRRAQNIRIYHECGCRTERSVPRIAVWHHEACRVMTKGDLEDRFFYHTLTQLMDCFSLLTTVFILFFLSIYYLFILK